MYQADAIHHSGISWSPGSHLQESVSHKKIFVHHPHLHSALAGHKSIPYGHGHGKILQHFPQTLESPRLQFDNFQTSVGNAISIPDQHVYEKAHAFRADGTPLIVPAVGHLIETKHHETISENYRDSNAHMAGIHPIIKGHEFNEHLYPHLQDVFHNQHLHEGSERNAFGGVEFEKEHELYKHLHPHLQDAFHNPHLHGGSERNVFGENEFTKEHEFHKPQNLHLQDVFHSPHIYEGNKRNSFGEVAFSSSPVVDFGTLHRVGDNLNNKHVHGDAPNILLTLPQGNHAGDVHNLKVHLPHLRIGKRDADPINNEVMSADGIKPPKTEYEQLTKMNRASMEEKSIATGNHTFKSSVDLHNPDALFTNNMEGGVVSTDILPNDSSDEQNSFHDGRNAYEESDGPLHINIFHGQVTHVGSEDGVPIYYLSGNSPQTGPNTNTDASESKKNTFLEVLISNFTKKKPILEPSQGHKKLWHNTDKNYFGLGYDFLPLPYNHYLQDSGTPVVFTNTVLY